MLLSTPHTIMLREMEFLGSTGMGNLRYFFFFTEPIPPRAQGSSLSENLGGRDSPSTEEAQDVYGMCGLGPEMGSSDNFTLISFQSVKQWEAREDT